ncbi:MAG TPA: RagB/SusD family nutrient uptake outer membrane protein [Sphingobacterium sp.]|nr:RagB/SusD family nutrient uptake outer membrane protein [Sphingobacterium sp.]
MNRLMIFNAIILLSLLASCNKYLDVKSNGTFVVPNNLESLQKILDGSNYINSNICAMGEAASDNYFLTAGTYNAMSEDWRRFYLWDNYEYTYGNDWDRAYLTVYNCNLVLDELKKIERKPENGIMYDNIKGTALFFRSVQYLSLVWTFAKAYDPNTAVNDLGIVLRGSSDFNELSSRASVQQCYDRIIADLIEGERLLPNNTSHVMRPSKISAYGMLARTFLSMRKYDEALKYADLYLLQKNGLLNFNDQSHVDWSKQYSFSQFNHETDSYMEMSPNGLIAQNSTLVDTLLYSSYNENDLRKKAYFKSMSDNYMTFVGSYSSGSALFAGIATDEMLLTRSECLARAGRASDALLDLNKLLQSRFSVGTFMPIMLEDNKTVLQIILNERRKELVFRGLRWIDIKRLNKEGADISIKRRIEGKDYILTANENRFALPLPMDIIAETGMPQNPK